MADDWIQDPMSRGLGAATRQDSYLRQVPGWFLWVVVPVFAVGYLFLLVAVFANGKILGGLIITFLPLAIIAVVWSNARRRRNYS